MDWKTILLSAILGVFLAEMASGYLTWIAVRLPLEGEAAPPGAPWPLPRHRSLNTMFKTIDPTNFQFVFTNGSTCDILEKAFERYSRWITLDPEGVLSPGAGRAEALLVTLADTRCDADYYPHDGMDESYKIEISLNPAMLLSAPTVWGALRGLETFSQLIYLTDAKEYRLNMTEITDSPRFNYRGLHLDTARHFITVPILMQALDAMSMDKTNVFHWHVVDDQSFPYPSRVFPNLTQLGAYSAYHQYSRQDVDSLLYEARIRGIRVIPEFDTPGHTWSWGRAFPDLLTPCWGGGLEGGPYVPNWGVHGEAEILNPMQEFTYQILDEFYTEVVEDFPDEFVHIGMDEVYYACWQSNPNISAWMAEQGFTEYSQVEEFFQTRLIDIVESKGARSILWQDPVDNNVTVTAGSLVEVWKDVSSGDQFDKWQVYTDRVASRGYDVILSAPWYLNMISYGQDWRNYYNVEPTDFTTDVDLQSKVKGGEACMWVEYADGTNLLSRIWPRASAVAERLWSTKETDDEEEAKYRLDQQRCRMVRRGIPAAPILNGYCGDYEWGAQDPVAPDTSGSGRSVLPSGGLLLSLILALTGLVIAATPDGRR